MIQDTRTMSPNSESQNYAIASKRLNSSVTTSLVLYEGICFNSHYTFVACFPTSLLIISPLFFLFSYGGNILIRVFKLNFCANKHLTINIWAIKILWGLTSSTIKLGLEGGLHARLDGPVSEYLIETYASNLIKMRSELIVSWYLFIAWRSMESSLNIHWNKLEPMR